MSYCRLSQDSDIHASQESEQKFVVMVGHGRVPPLSPEEEDALTAIQMVDWMKRNSAPIGGRCDGERYEFTSASDMVSKIKDLAVLGYRVEKSTWENIHKEHPEAGAGLLCQNAPRTMKCAGR